MTSKIRPIVISSALRVDRLAPDAGEKLRHLDLVKEDDATYFLLEEKAAKIVHKLRDPQMSDEEEVAVQENLAEVFDMPAGVVEEPESPEG